VLDGGVVSGLGEGIGISGLLLVRKSIVTQQCAIEQRLGRGRRGVNTGDDNRMTGQTKTAINRETRGEID